MYRIVKSSTVELSQNVYVISEAYRTNAPTHKKNAQADGEENEQPDSMQEQEPDGAQEMPYGQVDGGANIAEIKRLAEQQAEAILLDAAQRAQDSYIETLKRAEVEAQALREEAVIQGRAEGVSSKKEQIEQCVAQIEQAVIRMESEQAAFMVDYEQKLKWLALEIASKILSKKVEDNGAEMAELVQNAVSAAGSAKWVGVEVSNQMPELLGALEQSFADNDKVEVRAIAAPPGTCRIETAAGVVDASVYTQIENMKEYFASEQSE